jgi:SAM-dependent methyltransferase
MSEWWQDVFVEDYIHTYDVRTYGQEGTDPRTKREVDFLEEYLGLSPAQRILDVACGQGRHAVELARRGYRVAGVDLSSTLLGLARQSAGEAGVSLPLARADMRALPFREGFDVALSLFTAFGYFGDEAENARAAAAIARALAPGGRFLIDLNNACSFLGELLASGAEDERSARLAGERRYQTIHGNDVREELQFDPRSFRLHATKFFQVDGVPDEYSYSYQLYTLPELTHLLEGAGLRVEQVWGDFDGQPYRATSRRMIVRAARAGDPA